jgi:hypothetical protein
LPKNVFSLPADFVMIGKKLYANTLDFIFRRRRHRLAQGFIFDRRDAHLRRNKYSSARFGFGHKRLGDYLFAAFFRRRADRRRIFNAPSGGANVGLKLEIISRAGSGRQTFKFTKWLVKSAYENTAGFYFALRFQFV